MTCHTQHQAACIEQDLMLSEMVFTNKYTVILSVTFQISGGHTL